MCLPPSPIMQVFRGYFSTISFIIGCQVSSLFIIFNLRSVLGSQNGYYSVTLDTCHALTLVVFVFYLEIFFLCGPMNQSQWGMWNKVFHNTKRCWTENVPLRESKNSQKNILSYLSLQLDPCCSSCCFVKQHLIGQYHQLWKQTYR